MEYKWNVSNILYTRLTLNFDQRYISENMSFILHSISGILLPNLETYFVDDATGLIIYFFDGRSQSRHKQSFFI